MIVYLIVFIPVYEMGDVSKLESDKTCHLCEFFGKTDGSSSSKLVTVQTKGLESIISTSVERKDGFEKTLRDKDLIHVHDECRLKYYARRHTQTAKKRAHEEKEKNVSPVKKLRSAATNLPKEDSESVVTTQSDDLSPNVSKLEIKNEWQTTCFICDKSINTRKGKNKFSTITLIGKESVMKYVQDRDTE